MVDLDFNIESAAAPDFAAVPTLNFGLRVSAASQVQIHTIVLRCQIRIEPQRRAYDTLEKQHLRDLFDEPSRWGQTLRSLLWTHANVVIPAFTAETTVQMPVACSFDFNVAASKYFYALETGDVPLSFLFSGTVFYAGEATPLQIAQIPWEKESRFALPVSAWKQMMDLHYPNSAWLRLHRDAFDLLRDFKTANGLPTWEAAIEKLIAEQPENV